MSVSESSGLPVIMIIDDDELGRAVLAETVRPLAARVIELSSPIGATLAAAREAVDVVVVDWQMPNLTGDLVTRLLRRHPRLKNVGVVLVSAEEADALREIGSACGADAVVSKQQLVLGLPRAVKSALQMARIRLSRDQHQSDPVSGFQRTRAVKESEPPAFVSTRARWKP